MKLYYALKNRIIFRLWAALTLSCVGAEIYSFAVVWIATDRFGNDSGYLIALQAGIILFATLTSGALTEGFYHRNMMILSDLARFVATLLPFISWQVNGIVPTWLLVFVIAVVSWFRPVFDPALQAILPAISADRSQLQTINGLFDIVRRIARIAGPAFAAMMFTVMSVYNFFFFNAVTYLISAVFIFSISSVLQRIEGAPANYTRSGGFIRRNAEAIFGGFLALNRQFSINFHLIAYALCNAGWYVSLVIGLALKLHQQFPEKSEYFGYILGIYGVFNVLSNLIFSELTITRPVLAMSVGRLLSGLALLMMAMSDNILLIMFLSGIAALGAPVTQIPLATLMQTQFAKEDVVRVFRCRMFYEWFFLLLALLAIPALIHIISLYWVMMLSALCYLILGCSGLILTREVVHTGQS
ncbi:macrolide-efflux protein A [Xenorhabdus stockiae]|uniref:Macrolide-efflux protein A n=1 Tax=Xenorhabdus stockiae TaxID=351614 RepID=A0A2D0KNR3_9GAMM|nr:MFS transporter [Xenorhabdus stockiae]PHM65070.1 macrolide-efflux protein A [Xenorhabdus stockiae]